MAQETDEKEVYVYLDFQGKDTARILGQESVYFRMLNLSENKPIVEIGEDVYEGTYDDVVGTNLFFEEISEQPQNNDLFATPTPLTLKYLLKQSKLLKLEKIGMRQNILLNTPDTDTVNINIKEDYRNLLEKFENNKLNIDEYIVEEDVRVEIEDTASDKIDEENETNRELNWELSESPSRQSHNTEWYYKPSDNSAPRELLKPSLNNDVSLKYTKLQKIAEQPSKHTIQQDTVKDNKFEQPLSSVPKNNFFIWKNLMMQKVEHQVITVDVQKDRLEDFVDIDESIKAGIISPSSSTPRIITHEEKVELFSFKNFGNVSPLMKLIMLQDFEEIEETAIDQMSPEEVNEVTEDGCTPLERYNLIKHFKEELRCYLVSRLQEKCVESDQIREQITLDFKLSEAELTYYSSTSEEDEPNQCSLNLV